MGKIQQLVDKEAELLEVALNIAFTNPEHREEWLARADKHRDNLDKLFQEEEEQCKNSK